MNGQNTPYRVYQKKAPPSRFKGGLFFWAPEPNGIFVNLNKLEDHGGDFTMDDYKVYNLIWRRTIASQMSPAKLENITIVIDIYDDGEKLKEYYFTSKNQKVLFDGFTIIYKPYEVGDNCDDDVNDDQMDNKLDEEIN